MTCLLHNVKKNHIEKVSHTENYVSFVGKSPFARAEHRKIYYMQKESSKEKQEVEKTSKATQMSYTKQNLMRAMKIYCQHLTANIDFVSPLTFDEWKFMHKKTCS